MIAIADIVRQIAQRFPKLKEELRTAHIKLRPDIFVKKTVQLSFMFSIGVAVLLFFIFSIANISMLLIFPVTLVSALGLFMLFINAPKQRIAKRRRELDREVLFAGRFLLVKIHAGRPLLNALMEGASSFGVASKYFKEIVDDINMGTPIEKALDNAVKYSPSPKFRRILFQINSAIKVGIDISIPLESVLEEITHEQMTEIQRYGKKLNSLALFYMLLAIVMPSLGMAMLVVIGGLLGLPIGRNVFFIIILFLMVLQFIFITLFKAIRLSVNI